MALSVILVLAFVVVGLLLLFIINFLIEKDLEKELHKIEEINEITLRKYYHYLESKGEVDPDLYYVVEPDGRIVQTFTKEEFEKGVK